VEVDKAPKVLAIINLLAKQCKKPQNYGRNIILKATFNLDLNKTLSQVPPIWL
jgi:hypothetical protein